MSLAVVSDFGDEDSIPELLAHTESHCSIFVVMLHVVFFHVHPVTWSWVTEMHEIVYHVID